MRSARDTSAFSLLELIVVMGIITVLAVAVIPAANTTIRGFRLTQAADQLTSVLNFARHAAISGNHTVEVRFYQFGDPEIPGQQPSNPLSGQYRSLQIFQYSESGNASPLDKIERLPDGIIIDSGTVSSLLGASQKKTYLAPLDPQASLPLGVGLNYNTMVFQFRPDGSTNLQIGTNWFLTMHDALAGDNIKPSPMPHNFTTIQIDPIGGSLVIYRP